MKVLGVIEDELDMLLATDRANTERKELNRIRKRVQFLNICRNYLKSSPTEEFLKKELKRLEDFATAIDGRFTGTFAVLSDEKKARKEFHKEYGLIKTKEQIRTLRYLLK